jgi:hypothetical protein
MTSSGAFSSVEAERNVNIDVVGDEEAFLRLLYPSERQSVPCMGEIDLVDVQNWTGSELTSVTVSIVSSPDNLTVEFDADTFRLGDTEIHSISVTPQATDGSSGTGEIEFHVTAAGDGIFIQTTEPRSIDVQWDCPKKEASNSDAGNNGNGNGGGSLSVTFQQNGNKVTFGTGISGEATVWFSDNTGIGSTSADLNNYNKITKGSLDRDGNNNFDIIAVELPDLSGLFISPYWTGEELDSGFDGACKKEGLEDIAAFLGDSENFPVCE